MEYDPSNQIWQAFDLGQWQKIDNNDRNEHLPNDNSTHAQLLVSAALHQRIPNRMQKCSANHRKENRAAHELSVQSETDISIANINVVETTKLRSLRSGRNGLLEINRR